MNHQITIRFLSTTNDREVINYLKKQFETLTIISETGKIAKNYHYHVYLEIKSDKKLESYQTYLRRELTKLGLTGTQKSISKLKKTKDLYFQYLLKSQTMDVDQTTWKNSETAKLIHTNEQLSYLKEMYNATQIINQDKQKDLKTKILDYCKQKNPSIHLLDIPYIRNKSINDIQNYFKENISLLPPSKTHMEQYSLYVVLHIQEITQDLRDYINWVYYQSQEEHDNQYWKTTVERNQRKKEKLNI